MNAAAVSITVPVLFTASNKLFQTVYYLQLSRLPLRTSLLDLCKLASVIALLMMLLVWVAYGFRQDTSVGRSNSGYQWPYIIWENVQPESLV